MLPAGNLDEVKPHSGALYHKLKTHSSALEDGRNYCAKNVQLIEIINKPLLLHLVSCLYYCRHF